MNDAFRYDFAKSFSRFPGGRLRAHGPRSGEEFRDDILMPLMEAHERVLIDFTGVEGFGASFLDEVFGHVSTGRALDYLKSKFEFVAEDDPHLVALVWRIIEKAATNG